MRYVLGVDGGASKTHCLAATTDGRVIGFGCAGCASHESAGLEPAVAEVRTAVEAAASASGIAGSEANAACLGLAGADFPEDFSLLLGAYRGLARVVDIQNDSLIALRGGTRRPYGVVVIMGSGTNCAGISRDGREGRNIGEGYIYGDWGGANSIGSEAMHRVFREYDGRGEPTVLTQMVKEHFGEDDLYELAKKLYYRQIPLRRVWLVTPLVFKAAHMGDRVAREIVVRIGTEAGTTANAMMRKLHLTDCETDVVLAGSVFKGEGPLLMDTITEKVHSLNPQATPVRPLHPPVVGAVVMAIEKAGGTADEEVFANLQATMPHELTTNQRRND